MSSIVSIFWDISLSVLEMAECFIQNTVSERRMEMETSLVCSDGTRRTVPTAVSSILVLSVPQPVITITGTENVSKEYEEFKAGVRVFSDMTLSISQGGSGSEREEVDKCSITVFPPLNPDHEEMNLPEFMLKSLNLEGRVSGGEAEISGQEMIYNYQHVVRQVTYRNMKPAYYLNRQFKLLCSLRDKRFISNEFIETVRIFVSASSGHVLRLS